MTDFRTSYPIDFELYDKDTQNVLYIEDTSDQTLTLEITNASTQTIALENLTGDVSDSNYHFALRFRPGTLSAASLGNTNGIELGDTTNWQMLLSPADPSGMDVIYISRTTNLSMDPDASQTIVFNNVGADAGQGARGTRVELLYQSMAYSGETETLSGNRELHMSVINHRGKQNLPLHVGFVGDNGILNDGITQNTLTLRFSNTLTYDATNPDASSLSFSYNADETQRSKIILSFDVGTAADEWALGDSDGIAGIDITQPGGWDIIEPIEGESPEWILYPDTADQVLYGRNSGNTDYFDLEIIDIVSSFPTGHTQLHIRYENIPGYWDGQMKVTIEKRPLVYDGGNVGIGTTAATTISKDGYVGINNSSIDMGAVPFPLTVISDTLGTLGYFQATNTSTTATVRIIGNRSDTEATAAISLEIETETLAQIMAGREGAGLAQGQLRFAVHNGFALTEAMRIDKDGNVGIGTDEPEGNKLNVNGTINSTAITTDSITIADTNPDNSPLYISKSHYIPATFRSDNSTAIVTIGGTLPNTSTASAAILNFSIEDGSPGFPMINMAQIRAGKEIAGGNNGQLRFATNRDGAMTEAMRITKDGAVYIFTNPSTTDPRLVVYGNAAKLHGGTEWDILSDRRIKQDINPFTDSLEQLKKVTPVKYRYNGKAGTADTDTEQVGIIAQELREVFPYMVSTYNARLNETDEEDTELLSFNGSAMRFVIVNAIKELDASLEKANATITGQDKRIKKQDKLIKDLVTRVEALEAKLG